MKNMQNRLTKLFINIKCYCKIYKRQRKNLLLIKFHATDFKMIIKRINVKESSQIYQNY